MWFSSSDGVARRGGGCFFLPLLLMCGWFSMFGGSRSSGLLVPLILIGVVWLVMSSMSKARVEDDSSYLDEKPKRDKPKRDGDVVVGDDGELIFDDDDDRASTRY